VSAPGRRFEDELDVVDDDAPVAATLSVAHVETGGRPASAVQRAIQAEQPPAPRPTPGERGPRRSGRPDQGAEQTDHGEMLTARSGVVAARAHGVLTAAARPDVWIATLVAPLTTVPSVNRTKTRLTAAANAIGAFAAAKIANVGVAPAPIVTVTPGAGVVAHAPDPSV